ncbi:hypothetical protein A1O1_06009 [Capronia coronata CBS 617.96]|uniref:Uncharacterized protein n=1 Tax=Capronia coronata CBS 617.96 TaxID=1182541 RepID=W9XZH6_9EURO|nr:uncharacterized protein A1O1_06009 [Capronia coronata CBS 617.96]EXJ85643.1 hypothetical protein A1O1_06009 [Capronia coronata CBS 617.96]
MGQPSESEILYSYLLHPSPLSTILPFQTFQSLVANKPSSSSSNSARTTSSAHAARHKPELKRLYRDLEFQRDITVDGVRRRIDQEARRSGGLLTRLRRQVRREEGERQSQSTLNSRRKRKRVTDDEDEAGAGAGGDEDEDDDISSIGGNNDGDNGRLETQIDVHLDGPRGQTINHNNNPASTSRYKSNPNHTISTLITAMATAKTDLEAEIAALETELETVRRECEEGVGALSDLRYGRFAGPASARSMQQSDNDESGGEGKSRGGNVDTDVDITTTTTSTVTTTTTVEVGVVDALHDFTARLDREMSRRQR